MTSYDLLVVGAGPGGYVAAIRAAQHGMNVGVVDENDVLGGTCLRVGCIPSKALLESSEHFHAARHDLSKHGVELEGVSLDLGKMLQRKDQVVSALTKGIGALFRMHDITHHVGRGGLGGWVDDRREVRVAGPDGEVVLSAPNVILATGTTPVSIPGVDLDGDRIGSSTEALSYPQVPARLVVIGAGYIGLELGSVWSRLGSEVIVLEYLDRILPGSDTEIATAAQKLFKKQGLDIRLGSRVTGASAATDECRVEIEGGEPIVCDRVLVAVGRRPATEGLALEEAGVTLDERGQIEVDERFATRAQGVYAIGDIIGGPQLAHKAEEEGVACADLLAGGYGHVNYDAIPGVCYTDPEIATVGKTEEELVEAGVPFRKGTFPFRANGRARALNRVEGQVKILAHAETDRILGVHILGPRAGDLIAEAVTALEYSASSEDLFRTCHAHPTLSEVLKEAALDVHGRAIHR